MTALSVPDGRLPAMLHAIAIEETRKVGIARIIIADPYARGGLGGSLTPHPATPVHPVAGLQWKTWLDGA
jgi:hypothetical protein